MKANIIVKTLIFCLSVLFVQSCNDEIEPITYSEGSNVKIADAFLQINTAVVQFQAGLPDYTLDMNLVNGIKVVNKVNVYHTYTDAKTGAKSNETQLTSFDVPAGNKASLIKKLTYDDLKKGLKVNGADLPADQKELAVGSGWKLRFTGVSGSEEFPLDGTINVGVLSRFAGLYKVIDSDYFRIGVPTAKWTGQTRFIGSVDENTFSYNDYWGNFAWPGKQFRFSIDFATNKITTPIILPEFKTFAGNRAMSCETDENLFVERPCSESNVLIKEEATGKHVIKMTYGYFTDGSGPRAFYEVLEKIN